ncbi:ABC transporter ATP-binding protein [Acidithiobacillus sp.]
MSNATGPLFQLEQVRKTFKNADGEDLVILDDVQMELRDGEILVMVGRSGSGKSTLLRILAGLMPANGGSVLYQGKAVNGPVAGLAMVFQSFALFPWLTVLQNVELGLEALRVPRKERQERALRAIDLIGLDGFESAYPRELSGGMRQRVGFARALVIDPKVLLMDEPFSALDVLTAETLRTDLLDLWAERKTALRGILLVSHNIEEAVLMADRILIFGSNPGRIRAEIPVTLPQPRDRESLDFRNLVEQVYAIMSARPISKADGMKEPVGLAYRLPRTSINRMAGLLEALATLEKHGGAFRVNLSELADHTQFSVNDLFPLVEALEILGFTESDTGEIRLTPAGRLFAEGNLQERKHLFARHLMERVPLAAHIRAILDERSSHRAPADRFLRELEDHLSEGESQAVLDTIIYWGRYAEIFAYEDNAAVFTLEDPGH